MQPPNLSHHHFTGRKKYNQCNIHDCIILQGRVINGVQVYLHSLCRMLLKLSQILCVKVPSKMLSAKKVSNNVSFLFSLLQGVSNESQQGLHTIWNITTEPWLCVTGADVLMFLIVTRHSCSCCFVIYRKLVNLGNNHLLCIASNKNAKFSNQKLQAFELLLRHLILIISYCMMSLMYSFLRRTQTNKSCKKTVSEHPSSEDSSGVRT